MREFLRLGSIVLFLVLAAACTTKPERQYKIDQDVEPQGEFDVSTVRLVQPKWEPLSRQGNQKNYTVLGKRYEVMTNDASYEKVGYASWYGLKFHDELTSNGERYDMYSFSAAHKSLPLPSYVKVTNLENSRELVVRVNDRGPFHSDRIIDLSYAAAIKLGYKDQGTAKVRLERLFVPQPSAEQADNSQRPIEKTSVNLPPKEILAPYVQIAAFSSYDLAEAMRLRAESYVQDVPVFLATVEVDSGLLYRVRIGPFVTDSDAQELVNVLVNAKIGSPQVITRSTAAPER